MLFFKRFKKVILPVIIFGLTFVTYLVTLQPGIGLEDSPEFITVASTLGIAHPSGYPLYTLLGHFFSHIPFGSLPWRINLMSAFFAALTNVVLFYLIKNVLHLISATNDKKQKETVFFNFINSDCRELISFLVALLFGFTLTFWFQAIVAEVYSLHVFLFSLIILFFLRWWYLKDSTSLYLLSFFSGLSLTNHLVSALAVPGLFLIVIFSDIYTESRDKLELSFGKKIKIFLYSTKAVFLKNKRLYLFSLVLFIIGFSVYIYLPWRSAQNPALDWGNPENWSNFKDHLLRSEYNDLQLFARGKILLVQTFFQDLAVNFTLPLVFIGFIGLGRLFYKRYWAVSFMSLNIFLSQSLLIIFLRSYGWGQEIEYFYRVYYLPSYLVLALWLAVGLHFILLFLDKIWLRCIFWLGVLLLVISVFISNFQVNNYRDFHLPDQWIRSVFDSLPKNAILVIGNQGLSHDSRLFASWYLRHVESYRPDITLVNDCSLFYPDGEKIYLGKTAEERQQIFIDLCFNLNQELKKQVFTTFLPDERYNYNLTSRSNGLVYQLFNKAEAPDNLEFRGQYINPIQDKFLNNYAAQDYFADYYYALAAWQLEHGLNKDSSHNLIKAIQLDNHPLSDEYEIFVKHRANYLSSKN